MANWEIKSSYSGGDITVTSESRNVTGAPVKTFLKLDFGDAGALSAYAGVYRFKFESPTTVSCRVVYPEDARNPCIYVGNKTVVCDGSTENLSLVPGHSIIFYADADTDDEFEVGVGCHWDADLGVWNRVTAVGPKLAGFYDTERTLTAVNSTGLEQTSCRLVATNLARVENGVSVSRPFHSFGQIGELDPTADADLLGTAVTFNNYAGGSPPTVDILVGGSPIDVYDVTGDALISGGVGLKCNGVNVYRFADGTALQSVAFVLSVSLAETDTATVFVSDGGEFVQVAMADGDWVDGPTGIDLTDDDEVEGVVASAAEVDFRIHFGGPSDANVALNMRGYSLRITSEGV